MSIFRLSARRQTTVLLTITAIFLFSDQNLLAPNLSIIAKEFYFSNEERDDKLGAQIAFGFFIVGAPVSLLAGFFADITNRCILLGSVALIGSLASLSTSLAQTYTQLYMCRVVTGISIGGMSPIVYSLLGDYYAGKSRVKVATLIGVAVSSGITFGQLLSGLLGPTYGWRFPFMIIAMPTFLCSIMLIFFAIEPSRGEQENEIILFRSSIHEGATLQSMMIVDRSTEEEKVQILLHKAEEPLRFPRPGGGGQHLHTRPTSGEIYQQNIDCPKVLVLLKTKTVLLIYLQGIPGY